MRRLVLLLLPLLLLGTTTGPPSYAGDGATDRRPVRALITFDKDAQHPWDSRVVWRAWRQDPDGTWEMTEHREWRAGSGFGGPDTTHECVRNRGWLPNGRYSFVQRDDYAGSLIHGRVFFLGAKACRTARSGTTCSSTPRPAPATSSARTRRATRSAAGSGRRSTTTAPQAASRWRRATSWR
ncbi:hypothetical protein [Nocardioides sp. LS1]|uniref:hypothetical protein n=1 Tax=Nocardioides sp. LS1 TaxID=1027620 RepID=UPI000F61ABEB|nr:hypothetical protein [Nocardioides sp. LS1]